MPQKFDNCVKNGGKVRTINPKEGVYLRVCYLNRKSFIGEIKHTKETKK